MGDPRGLGTWLADFKTRLSYGEVVVVDNTAVFRLQTNGAVVFKLAQR